MCTWIIERTPVTGSAKGPIGWMPLTEARVFYDHPHYTQEDHTLNIDFVDESQGIDARVAIELTAESALALVDKILAAMKTGQDHHGLEVAVAKVAD